MGLLSVSSSKRRCLGEFVWGQARKRKGWVSFGYSMIAMIVV
jgi:hypothetical protein